MTSPQDREPATGHRRVVRAAVALTVAALSMLLATTASAATTGVQADGAVVSADGHYLDVFATSPGANVQVDGTPAVPMAHDAGSTRFYVRLVLSGAAPASVTVRNLSDNPASTSTVAVKAPTGITITKAEFDGNGRLTVGATSSKGEALTAAGLGAITNPSGTDFAIQAPPRTVTVTGASGSETAPVVITGGTGTPATTPTAPTTTTTAPTTTTTAPTSTPTTTTTAPTTTSTTAPTTTSTTAPTTTVSSPAPTQDVVTVTEARHRLFSDLRIQGLGTVPGAVETIVDTTPVNGVPRGTVLGTATVGASDSWELRLRPGPTAQVTSIRVQSSRGGSAVATVATR